MECSLRTKNLLLGKVTQFYDITWRKTKIKMIAKKYVLYPPACCKNFKLNRHICYNEVASCSLESKIFEKKLAVITIIIDLQGKLGEKV